MLYSIEKKGFSGVAGNEQMKLTVHMITQYMHVIIVVVQLQRHLVTDLYNVKASHIAIKMVVKFSIL